MTSIGMQKMVIIAIWVRWCKCRVALYRGAYLLHLVIIVEPDGFIDM